MKAKIVLVMSLVIAISIAATGIAFAISTPVFVLPLTQTKEVDETFTVDVWIEPTVNISVVTLGVSWDPAFVHANGYVEGNLLNQDGATTNFFGGAIDNVAGTMATITGQIVAPPFPTSPVDDPGIFVTLNFTATNEGSTAITLTGVVVYSEFMVPIEVIMAEGLVIVTDVGLEDLLDCFIATAAYGTSTGEELDTLRDFRDEALLQNSLGSQFVDFYYEYSPPVADFISEHEVLRTLVREVLVDPVAWLVKATGTLWRD